MNRKRDEALKAKMVQYQETTAFMLDKLIEVSKAAKIGEHTMMWQLIQACFYNASSLKRLRILMDILLQLEQEELSK